jgi:hypothetical protein
LLCNCLKLSFLPIGSPSGTILGKKGFFFGLTIPHCPPDGTITWADSPFYNSYFEIFKNISSQSPLSWCV